MGQNITTINWYNYGKARFLKNGYHRTESKLTSELDNVSGKKIIAITGANQGIGRAMTKQLTERGHSVLMICRNRERAERARDEILEEIAASDLEQGKERVLAAKPEIVIADCGDPEALQNAISSIKHVHHLDALVCNAGALFDKFTLNKKETHEFNLSVFILHGGFLLTRLCLPLLQASEDPRVVFVSSGGMYRTKLNMDTLTKVTERNYDGTEAYCQCKRAQVILAELFAKKFPQVNFYSCHPGWALTQGVKNTKALDQFVKWTGAENWRTSEEAALGVSYLSTVDSKLLKAGEFYLDGEIAPKHLPNTWYSWAGPSTSNQESISNELWSYCEKETAEFLL